MQITAQEIEYCKLKFHCEAEADQIDNKKTEVLMLFKDLPVKGFRKGVKASMDTIRIAYAKEINNSLKQALAEEAYHNALFDQDVKAFGAPQFSNISLADKKFVCDFECLVRPKFELKQYKELEIVKKPSAFNVEEEIEKTIEGLRNKFGESRPFEEADFVQTGDTVIIDYEAFCDGVKIESISGQGQLMNVGQTTLPGFDENLLGMKNGEVRQFYIKAPEDSMPSFAGKEIKFVVSLAMGSKTTPMSLGDELAQKAGKATFAELREFVVGFIQAKIQEEERAKNIEQITKLLIAEHDIKVPSWLSLSEAEYLVANSGLKWIDLPDTDKEHYLNMANQNVKLSLILEAIRDKEPEAQLSDQEVLASIEQNLGSVKTKKEIDEFMMQLNKSGRLSLLATRMRDEYVLDFILKNTKIIE